MKVCEEKKKYKEIDWETKVGEHIN